MAICNIAGYKFIALNDLATLKSSMLQTCKDLNLRGTIILSPEGINLMLAGKHDAINEFKCYLKTVDRLNDIIFNESESLDYPFKRMKIKIKKEVITLRKQNITPQDKRAPAIDPHTLKTWLDNRDALTLLDTRNEYEIRLGSFKEAVNLHLNNFMEFTKLAEQIPHDKPIVMYCTGGIRCEKAALYLLQQGYDNVFQLEGGILNYFAQVGGDHYVGDCYVFDERTAIDAELKETNVKLCTACQFPLTSNSAELCATCSRD